MGKEHVEILKDLETRKEIFEEVAQLVMSLHKLSTSLEDIVYDTGQHTAVDKAHELLESLDDKQRNLSLDKVEFRLEHLDLKIRDDISFFLSLADTSKKTGEKDLLSHPLSEELAEEAADLYAKIEEFKRKVQLCFAYRVLLCENGYTVKPIDLDLAPELISSALENIKEKELFYQSQLVEKLEDFQNKAKKIIIDGAIPESVRDQLMFAEHQISENLAHLKSGKPISRLPTSFESIVLKLNNDESAGDESATKTNSSEADSKDTTQQDKSTGFMSRAKKWLNSSVDVSWKDTK